MEDHKRSRCWAQKGSHTSFTILDAILDVQNRLTLRRRILNDFPNRSGETGVAEHLITSLLYRVRAANVNPRAV
ncbi:hypothetical protein ASPFODRAFT_348750 [Aspergillus luchuensis CBS 106.47]|uniref:Uncharacterized protein n=1 Tax=Aspergillus luchuensis (strain CBS 106.47) TaxID=1137211 RepID=A0A1M3T636_ASPLC|nr:hypothetical protein ASPFODRAFT_348750 [Aspergillus luchuensis CBS 106.47]